MIKILHTSDWHLGHLFRNYDREDEFRYFFDQLYDTIRVEHPDIVCIAGDIFDTMNPSLGAQNLWAEVLGRINGDYPDIPVVAIAGNHDSGSKLAVYRNLMREGIHIVGRNAEVFRFERSGNGVIVAAVPYIPEGHYATRLAHLAGVGIEDVDNSISAYFAKLGHLVDDMRQEGDATVLMAHLAVTNSNFQGQERYKFNFHDADVLGDMFDYTALGHIHLAQNVGSSAIRYSGAPMAMGFDENYPHSLSIIELDGHGMTPRIREIEIKALRPALTLPEDGPLATVDVDLFLNCIDRNRRCYLRVNVMRDDDYGVSVRRRIESAFEGGEVRFGYVNVIDPVTEGRSSLESSILPTSNVLREINPVDIATRFYANALGRKMSPRVAQLLSEIISDDNVED